MWVRVKIRVGIRKGKSKKVNIGNSEKGKSKGKGKCKQGKVKFICGLEKIITLTCHKCYQNMYKVEKI